MARSSDAIGASLKNAGCGVPDADRYGLNTGGNRIRTIGPAEKETAVERGPAADHRFTWHGRPLRKPFKLTGLLSRDREQVQRTADQAADHRPVHPYVLQVSADRRLDAVREAARLPAAHDGGDEADQLGAPR